MTWNDPPSEKVTSLVELIKKSDDFEEEFVKWRLETIQEERATEGAKETKWIEIEAAKEVKQIEIEEKQKKREFEMRRLEIASRIGNPNREEISEADNIRVKERSSKHYTSIWWFGWYKYLWGTISKANALFKCF